MRHSLAEAFISFGIIMRNNVIFQENLDISDMHICSLHEICSVTGYSLSTATTQKINKIKKCGALRHQSFVNMFSKFYSSQMNFTEI